MRQKKVKKGAVNFFYKCGESMTQQNKAYNKILPKWWRKEKWSPHGKSIVYQHNSTLFAEFQTITPLPTIFHFTFGFNYQIINEGQLWSRPSPHPCSADSTIMKRRDQDVHCNLDFIERLDSAAYRKEYRLITKEKRETNVRKDFEAGRLLPQHRKCCKSGRRRPSQLRRRS